MILSPSERCPIHKSYSCEYHRVRQPKAGSRVWVRFACVIERIVK